MGEELSREKLSLMHQQLSENLSPRVGVDDVLPIKTIPKLRADKAINPQELEELGTINSNLLNKLLGFQKSRSNDQLHVYGDDNSTEEEIAELSAMSNKKLINTFSSSTPADWFIKWRYYEALAKELKKRKLVLN